YARARGLALGVATEALDGVVHVGVVDDLRRVDARPGVAVVVPPRHVVAEGLDVDVAIRVQGHWRQAVEHRRVAYAGHAAQDVDHLGPVDAPRGGGGVGADALQVADH